MHIKNGDVVIFATHNQNKIQLYKNLFGAQGVNITLLSLDNVQEVLAMQGKHVDLTLPPEDTVDTQGTYAGNSMRKCRYIASLLRKSGAAEYAKAKIIADDWGYEIEGLHWAVDKATGYKTICTDQEKLADNAYVAPFPGLDTRPFTESLTVEADKDIPPHEHDVILHKRAAEMIKNRLPVSASPEMRYISILSVIDMQTREEQQYSGKLEGNFCYPPRTGPYGWGSDIFMQPKGHTTTISTIEDREAKGLVAEALAVKQAVTALSAVAKYSTLPNIIRPRGKQTGSDGTGQGIS